MPTNQLRAKRARISIVMKVSLLAGSIAAITSLIVGSLIVSGTTNIVYQNALNRLKYQTNIKSLKLISDIKNLSGDAQYLVGSPPVSGIPRALHNNGIDPLDKSHLETWKNRLATIFTELLRAKPHYMQIRYIGISDQGKELLRVDRKGSLIQRASKRELQLKSDTEYFKQTIRVNPSEVYLSDITLNREHGKISEPYMPVLRAATPVYFNQELFGMIVINMAFNDIFTELIKNTPRELVPYVTNEDGYFLAHPNKNMTYGFDLGFDASIHTIYTDFDLQRNGDIRDIEFTVETISDVVHVIKAYYDPLNKERFFAVMLATSYNNLNSGSLQLWTQSLILMGLLIVLSLLASAALASRLMRPLQLISRASEDLAKGHEVLNLPVQSNDEIGELARSFDNMHRQLEEKERELIVSQGHVHHANKMASLGEMASAMAHEINSPIQSINLIAQRVQRQLKKNISTEEIDASMNKISHSVSKISEIIESLRKVSRGSFSDEFQGIALHELMQDVLNIIEERFKVNNVSFELIYHDVSENTLIQCQRLQISQVLINLVNNAYDAISEYDEKWIKIDIRKSAELIVISVTDSGRGVPEQVIDRVFEPMFTTKEIGKGTGLGLSISNEIVLKHNGSLYIDKDCKNTKFVLELPSRHIK